MRKLILRATAFALVQIVVGAVLLSFYDVDESAYLAATHDKHALLERPSTKPRLIFVGGSNVAFGVNSAVVARDLPYEPINLALHVGVGLRLMLREVEQSLRPGDVVILSPEYQHFTGRRAGMVLPLLEQRPASIQYVPPVFIPTLLDHAINHAGVVIRASLRNILGRSSHTPAAAPYARHAFNRYGDVVGHWRMERPSKLTGFGFGAYSDGKIQAMVGHLNRFDDRVRAKHARVFFWYPTIPRSTLREHRETIAKIEAEIRRTMTIPVLNQPDAATLPLEFFFDTHYHLTEKGMTYRTRMLIQSLRPHIDLDDAVDAEDAPGDEGAPGAVPAASGRRSRQPRRARAVRRVPA